MYTWNPPEDIAAMAGREAILAGKKASIQLDLEEHGYEIERESIRHRLGRTLVQLGVFIDPLAATDKKDDD